jgi:hypothetical protein
MDGAWTQLNSLKSAILVTMTTSLALVSVGSGAAWAQIETCPGISTDPALLPIQGNPGYMSDAHAAACNSAYGGCFRMDGSDTMTKIIQGAIEGSGACFSYHNTDDTQGESNMLFGGGIDGLSSRARTAYQGLAPMSRNFTSAILANPVGATWAPNEHNVVGIDVGVITFQSMIGQCVELDDTIPSACAGECYTASTKNVSALAVLISGNPAGSATISKGTTAECSDACRTCLVDQLASSSCEPVNRIEHIFRPDDKSGTQDVFRKIGASPVKYWCNGKSEGNNGLPGSNLKNEDLDPIRRGCANADSTHAYSKCTYYPLKYACQNSDADLPANSTVARSEPSGAHYVAATHKWVTDYTTVTYTNPHNAAISCTQGLIVALSENDPGSDDITSSIGNRVKNDLFGYSIGMAGWASASPPLHAVNINGVIPSAANIYSGAHKLWGLLYLERNATYTDKGHRCSDPGVGAPCDPTFAAPLGRKHEEDLLWNWATRGGLDACNLSPTVLTSGFLDRMEFACTDNCTSGVGVASETGIVTCAGYSAAGVGTPKQNVGAQGETCPTVSSADGQCYPFVADGALYGGCPLDGGNINPCIAGTPASYPNPPAVNAILVASRDNGYAPLAVHFDATGSTSTTAGISDAAQGGTFRQIKHAFSFGDPSSGTHSISGLSKNSEPSGGGLAAHVFDTPGTYVVKVTSTDGSGSSATASVTIAVNDPSVLTTYAISKSGNFTGAPAGSTHLTQSTLPTFSSNCRYFFNRGEDWSSVQIFIGDPLTNVHIDAYGTGANPTFLSVGVGTNRPGTVNFASDIRVNNITVQSGLSVENGSRVLFYNCTTLPGGGVGLSWTPTDQYMYIKRSDFINTHEIFYVNCQLLGDGTSGNYNLIGNCSRLVFLNTYSKGTAVGNVRFSGFERSVIRHSRFDSPTNNTFHALKVHSGGPTAYADNWLASGGTNSVAGGSIDWMTNKVVLANNIFGGGDNGAIANWTVAICPQNDTYGLAGAEPIQDVILENNNFIHAAGWSGRGNADIAWGGRRITSRANSVTQGSGSLSVGKGHSQVAAYDGPYFTN